MSQAVGTSAQLDDEQLLERGRQWLAEHAPDYVDPDGIFAAFPGRTVAEHAAVVERARRWEAFKAAEGWAGLSVPTEWGGQGRSTYVAAQFSAAEGAYGLDFETFAIAKMMVTPTLLAWGTVDQKSSLLPRLLDGTDVWCQLFSEPAAGSDLAGLTTRATQTGAGGWLINGQKVWNSGANHADKGYLLARTDPNAPKHAGITAFWLDMRAPGITVRPIRQITGGYGFCEVFLDDVEVPDAAVIGDPDNGWRVAITTLMNERLSMSAANVPWPRLRTLLDELDGAVPPELGLRAARLHAALRGVEQIHREELAALRDSDGPPGPEGSVLKLLIGRLQTEAGRIATEALAAQGTTSPRWTEAYLGSFGVRIGGGTDEILKNLIADRVLGLPREPRLDVVPVPDRRKDRR